MDLLLLKQCIADGVPDVQRDYYQFIIWMQSVVTLVDQLRLKG